MLHAVLRSETLWHLYDRMIDSVLCGTQKVYETTFSGKFLILRLL